MKNEKSEVDADPACYHAGSAVFITHRSSVVTNQLQRGRYQRHEQTGTSGSTYFVHTIWRQRWRQNHQSCCHPYVPTRTRSKDRTTILDRGVTLALIQREHHDRAEKRTMM